MAARITQDVVNIRNQLKAKDEELLHSKEEGLFHYFSRLRGFAQIFFLSSLEGNPELDQFCLDALSYWSRKLAQYWAS